MDWDVGGTCPGQATQPALKFSILSACSCLPLGRLPFSAGSGNAERRREKNGNVSIAGRAAHPPPVTVSIPTAAAGCRVGSPALAPRPWACVCFVLFSFQVENTALPEGKQASPAPWNVTSLPRFSIPSLYPSACGGWPGPVSVPPSAARSRSRVRVYAVWLLPPALTGSLLSLSRRSRSRSRSPHYRH